MLVIELFAKPKLVVGLVSAALITFCPAPAKSEEPVDSEDIYYNLSDDPDSLQLLGLGNISSEGGFDYITVYDLYRGELTHGFVATWEIDCPRERMRIVKAMQFDPQSSGEETDIEGEVVAARSSAASWTMFKLVCEGSGNLLERRMFYEPLDHIIRRFWDL